MADVALVKLSVDRRDMFLNWVNIPHGEIIFISPDTKVSVNPVWFIGGIFFMGKKPHPHCFLSDLRIGDERTIVLGAPDQVSKAFQIAARSATQNKVVVPFPEAEMKAFYPFKRKSSALEHFFGYSPLAVWCLEHPTKTLEDFPEKDSPYGPKSIADAKSKLGGLGSLAERLKAVHTEMVSDLVPQTQPLKRPVKKRKKAPHLNQPSPKSGFQTYTP